MLLVVKVYLFAIIVLSLKGVLKCTESSLSNDVYLYAVFETSRYWRRAV